MSRRPRAPLPQPDANADSGSYSSSHVYQDIVISDARTIFGNVYGSDQLRRSRTSRILDLPYPAGQDFADSERETSQELRRLYDPGNRESYARREEAFVNDESSSRRAYTHTYSPDLGEWVPFNRDAQRLYYEGRMSRSRYRHRDTLPILPLRDDSTRVQQSKSRDDDLDLQTSVTEETNHENVAHVPQVHIEREATQYHSEEEVDPLPAGGSEKQPAIRHVPKPYLPVRPTSATGGKIRRTHNRSPSGIEKGTDEGREPDLDTFDSHEDADGLHLQTLQSGSYVSEHTRTRQAVQRPSSRSTLQTAALPESHLVTSERVSSHTFEHVTASGQAHLFQGSVDTIDYRGQNHIQHQQVTHNHHYGYSPASIALMISGSTVGSTIVSLLIIRLFK